MPRFFFHLHNDVIAHDRTGVILPSLDEARKMAMKAVREVMATDLVETGRITLSHWIAIHNEAGDEELVLPFRACVEIKP